MIDFNKIDDVERVTYNQKDIGTIRKGLEVIWEAIKSCFGSGFWVNEKPWLNGEGWKNGKTT